MLKRLMLSVIFVSVFAISLPVTAATPPQEGVSFHELRAYMCKYYMHGLYAGKNSMGLYYGDWVFLADLQSNQLFKDFKAALHSSKAEEVAEAKKTFDYVLTGLNDCVTRELSFHQRKISGHKKTDYCVYFIEAVSIAYMLKQYYDDTFFDSLKGVFGLGFCFGMRFGRKCAINQALLNAKALQRRIAVWQQLLSAQE